MAVRKKAGQWVVEFTLRGHRVFKRLPRFAGKEDALAYEAQCKREIFEQSVLKRSPEVTIHDALKDWLDENKDRKAHKKTSSHAKCVEEIVGAHPLGKLVEAAGLIRQAGSLRGWSAASVNRRLCCLKAAGKHAFRKGWTQDNLSARIPLLPEGPPREVYLTHAQVEALLQATPDFARDFVALAVYTGLRQGEVMALQPEDVGDDFIRVRDSKTGFPRLVPLVEAAKPHTLALPFTSHVRTLYKGFETAREAIGMPQLRYHDLRHTTASLMIQSGVPIFTVGEILGHRSTQTTKRYSHLSMGNKREALEAAFPSKSNRSKVKPLKTLRKAA